MTSQSEYEELPSDIAFGLFLDSLDPAAVHEDGTPRLSEWELRLLLARIPDLAEDGDPHREKEER